MRQKENVSLLNLKFSYFNGTSRDRLSHETGVGWVSPGWRALANVLTLQSNFKMGDSYEFELNIQESPADATESDFYAVTVPFI
jgi:hypothetical protein